MPIISELSTIHSRSEVNPTLCAECSRVYPCRTRKLVDDAGLSAAFSPDEVVLEVDGQPVPGPSAGELIDKLITTSPSLWAEARRHSTNIAEAGCECMGVASLREFARLGWLNAEGQSILKVFTDWASHEGDEEDERGH